MSDEHYLVPDFSTLPRYLFDPAWDDPRVASNHAFEVYRQARFSGAAFGDGALALAFFDPLAEGIEDFDEAWANDLYLTELPTGQVITAAFGGGAVEDLEDGWANDAYATSWDEVAAVVGQFDVDPREDFEEQWRANQAFIWVWEMAVGAMAVFDAGTDSNEDFENDWSAATSI